MTNASEEKRFLILTKWRDLKANEIVSTQRRRKIVIEEKIFRKDFHKLAEKADESSWLFDVVQLSVDDVTYNIDADAAINMLR